MSAEPQSPGAVARLSLENRDRLRVYPWIIAAAYVVLGAFLILSGPGLRDRFGKPVGGDFVTFYAASALVNEGKAALSYDLATLHAREREVIAAPIDAFAFHYPPPVLILIAPLARLPYGWALALWTLLGLATYVFVVRRHGPDRLSLAWALAFPGLFQSLIHGQNGALTALVLALGLWSLPTRPMRAGLVLGALVCKPQLAPMVWLALALAGRWRALAGVVASAGLLLLASRLVLGPAPFAAFLANAPFASRLALAGGLPLAKMPTFAAAALLLGAPAWLALTVQGLAALSAAWLLLRVLRRRPPFTLEAAAIATAVLVALPFGFEYDWTLAILPLLWLYAGLGARLSRADALTGLGVWLAPLLAPLLASVTHVQVAPWLALALLLRIERAAATAV